MPTETVNGFGPLTARYAIIGEAPGKEERRQGQPFVGPSGRLLRDALERVGLDPDEAYITNVYKEYRSGNPTPTTAEINATRDELSEELSALPNLEGVLLLGNTPLKAFTGNTGITKRRGLCPELRIDLEGGGSEVRVFATLHPAAILRNVRYKSDWLNDLATFAAMLDSIEEDVEIVMVKDPIGLTAMEADLELQGPLGALDIETTIGDPFNGDMELVSVAVTFDGKRAWVLTREHPKVMRQGLARLYKGEWIMHNGSFDLMVLRQMAPHFPWKLAHDTMAMAYLLHPEERKGLEILSGVYLGLPPYKGVDYKNILEEPMEEVAAMNGRDVCRTYNLFRPLADEMNEFPHLSRTYQWLLLPAISRLVDITVRGVPVDRSRLETLEQELQVDLDRALDALQAQVGPPDPETYGKDDWPKGTFNPGSAQQVAHVLFDQMQLPVIERTDTGAPSTGAAVLEKLKGLTSGDERALIEDIMAYRNAKKLLSAFISSWWELMDDNDRLHPRYKPTQVVTGRLASAEPNIQQVPRDPRFRNVFGGVEGHRWLKADLSQIELRIAAWLSREETMLEAYRNGEDLHRLTAKLVLGDDSDEARQVGKTLNFGLLYGAYPGKLQEVALNSYGVTLTKQEAEKFRALFFDTYPRLSQMHEDVKMQVHATGRVESPLGRVRTFPEIQSDDEWMVKQAEREAVNHPIQSFASDLLVSALVRLPDDVAQYAIAEVHDELDFLVPVAEVERVIPIIKATMEDVEWLKKWGITLDVPVLAEIEEGDYWK